MYIYIYMLHCKSCMPQISGLRADIGSVCVSLAFYIHSVLVL